MNNDKIKTILSKLYDCKIDFTVIMTGKKSSRVNGFYTPTTCEIFLHNKNFKNDNELMYTAIHELTHHILTSEKGIKNVKSHSGIFWATFYDLVDKAVEQGFYSRDRSHETKALVEQAKKIQSEIIKAQKKLGEIIKKIYSVCEKNGDRTEDVIEHDLQMSRKKARNLCLLSLSSGNENDEMSIAINQSKDEKIKQIARSAAIDGKTIEQVKAISKQKPRAADDDLESPEQLAREKKRLENTIERLKDRLIQVEETLNSMLEGGYDKKSVGNATACF